MKGGEKMKRLNFYLMIFISCLTMLILIPTLNAEALSIESDNLWKVTTGEDQGDCPGTIGNPGPAWTTVAFDDSSWSNSTAPYEVVGCNPWPGFDPPIMWMGPPATPGHLEVFFRRSFTLSAPPISAEAQVYVDDNFQMYVNGVFVQKKEYLPALNIFDITPYLQIGENVFAIRAWDGDPSTNGCGIYEHICKALQVSVNIVELSDFSIVAEESVFISFRGKVTGDKGVSGRGTDGTTVTLLDYGSIHGNVYAGRNVQLNANTKVTGDVISAGAVSLGFNARVEGDIRQFENPEIAIVPPMPTCPSSSQTGDDDMDTPGNSGPHIVPPGGHGHYTYRNNNKVIFEGGDYTFKTLFFGARTHIEFQGPTTIYISEELEFSNNVKQALNGSVTPEEVLYILVPDIFAIMGARSNIFGTFCATGSDVILMNDASLTGAIYAKIVKVGKYSTIISAPSDLP